MLSTRAALVFLALSSLVALPACSGAVEPSTDDEPALDRAASALEGETDDGSDDGPAQCDRPKLPSTFVLTASSFDPATGTLEGTVSRTRGAVVAFTGIVAPATRVLRSAPLNLWPPQPIIPELVATWNALFVGTSGPVFFATGDVADVGHSAFAAPLASLAEAGAHLRLKVRRDGTVRSIRPVP